MEQFLFPSIFLAVGFIGVIQGADWLVDGASSLARRFGLSSLFIGLTIVAFGTSAPELIVNITSAIKGTTDLALGNILGSNIANIFLILGVAAIAAPLLVDKKTVFSDIPFSFFTAILLFILALVGDSFGRIHGIVLLGGFIVFLLLTLKNRKAPAHETVIHEHSLVLTYALIIGGLIALIIGGQLIVSNAITLATLAGISQTIIGLTIVAIGTSLPELATSVVAARRGNAGIAIGNIIGSNIFNVLFILGITAVMHPIAIPAGAYVDMGIGAAGSLLLFVVLASQKKTSVARWFGWLLFSIYIFYLAYLIGGL